MHLLHRSSLKALQTTWTNNTLTQNLILKLNSWNRNTFSFLDIKLWCGNDNLTPSVYRKPTFSGVFTNSASFIPLPDKFGIVNALIFRCFSEAVSPSCSIKKVLLEISQNSQENWACNVIKKRVLYRCFLVNFVKFLRTLFLTEHLLWLLLHFVHLFWKISRSNVYLKYIFKYSGHSESCIGSCIKQFFDKLYVTKTKMFAIV